MIPVFKCRRCAASVTHDDHEASDGSRTYVQRPHTAPCGCVCTVNGCAHNPPPPGGDWSSEAQARLEAQGIAWKQWDKTAGQLGLPGCR